MTTHLLQCVGNTLLTNLRTVEELSICIGCCICNIQNLQQWKKN